MNFHREQFPDKPVIFVQTIREVKLFFRKEVMSLKKGKLLVVTVLSVILVGSACLFSPSTGDDPPPTGYHSPVDSAYKVIENFELAYETKNMAAYMECLHEEYEFKLLEVDWDDYDGDGIIDESWGLDIEEDMTQNMFTSTNAEIIELTLDGNSESVWFGDSTHVTLQLVRSFELKVYFYDEEGVQQGFRAAGQAVFLCKPNDDGDYVIWQQQDLSET